MSDIVLPERPRVNQERIRAAVANLLTAIGEDPTRDGLLDTPARVARMWAEFIDHDPGTLTTTFASANTDQMIVVSGMRVWSMCEHHLLPFWCDVSIAYIPAGRILGLSKFARIAQQCAHRLQTQEQLVLDIHNGVMAATGSVDVAVQARGEHLCMTMRGVRTPGLMTNTAITGTFGTDAKARQEFLMALAQPSPLTAR